VRSPETCGRCFISAYYSSSSSSQGKRGAVSANAIWSHIFRRSEAEASRCPAVERRALITHVDSGEITLMKSPDDGDRYMRSCRTEFWKGIFRAEIDYLLEHLRGSKSVLSVGCGPAIIGSALSERGFRVTGLDVSQEALDRAPDRVRAVAARAESMPFAESSFDAVIYVASLQFVEDYRKAIEKTAHVLRPGGRLVVMLLNPNSPFFRGQFRDPNSYVHRIRHTKIHEIESAIAERFQVHGEYFMGVKEGIVFESRDAATAALYVISGIRKHMKEGRKARGKSSSSAMAGPGQPP